jgi:hypothetical protein
MQSRTCLVVCAIAAPLAGHAGSLKCQGNFISPGITEEQLLQACGEPVSRDGANWRYEPPGSVPQVVTLGTGVVMFIRDADEVASPGDPLGAHP